MAAHGITRSVAIARGLLTLVLLFIVVVAVWSYSSFNSLMDSTEKYNTCQTAGSQMQNASDYLTDEARQFASTGNIDHMQNYFTEAKSTKRRDNALEKLKECFGGSDLVIELQQSLANSIQLMQTEYYSMRLVCEACGIDENLWPDEVKSVTLSSEDSALSAQDKQREAQNLLLDSSYYNAKQKIDTAAEACTSSLMLEMQGLVDRYTIIFSVTYLLMIAGFLVTIGLSFFLWRANRKLKEYQAELEQTAKAAQASSAAKTRFLFNMSHDIRTPMNAIIGFSELLEKHRDDDEHFEHDLNGIQTSGAYLLDVIDNVLDMARIESGKLEVHPSAIDLGSLNERIEAVFSEQLSSKQLSYSFKRTGSTRTVMADYALLSKAVLNVVGNAVKYTPEGNTIAFELSQTETAANTCDVAIVVRDSGIGMSEEFLAHAFDAFEREHNTTESGIGGTGLGLGIVKGIMDNLGGTVRIESTLGAGSSVYLSFSCELAQTPAENEEDAVSSGEAADAAGANFSGRRALLAEDNDINAEIAIELLEDTGLAIERAEDGEICVEMLTGAEAGYYDVVLMDIQMPNMNGYDATRAIRALPDAQKASIPIIAMTANAFDSDKRDAAEAGMNGHVAKPIDVAKLLEALAEVLGK